MPNPGSALGYDRFAYVSNNPLKYIDPSGHRECTSPNCDGSDDLPPGKPYLTVFPATKLDTKKLNNIPFRYHDNGTPVHTEREVYQDYIRTWKNLNSWVWDVYGGDGEYSLDEHLAMLLLGETANIWHEATGLYESEVREYFEFSKYFRLDPDSAYSLLSFIVREYESLDYAVGKYGQKASPWASKQENIASTQTLMNYFQNPPSSWTTGYGWDRPYWSGNDSMLTDIEQSALRTNYSKIYFFQESFIVMSGCVWLLHESGTLTNTTISSCPVVGGN